MVAIAEQLDSVTVDGATVSAGTESVPRMLERSVWATARSTKSPTRWPLASLIRERWSISMKATVSGRR